MDTSDHGLSRTVDGVVGSCEWFDRHQKCVGEVPLHFELQLNTLGVFICPTVKNLKDSGQANVGPVPRIPLADMF